MERCFADCVSGDGVLLVGLVGAKEFPESVLGIFAMLLEVEGGIGKPLIPSETDRRRDSGPGLIVYCGLKPSTYVGKGWRLMGSISAWADINTVS